MIKKIVVSLLIFSVIFFCFNWLLGEVIVQYEDWYTQGTQQPGQADDLSLEALRILFVVPVSVLLALVGAVFALVKMRKK
ncbi:MAG: hypothetical protein QF790_07925 [Gammaproteobacteria bacterium]|jgi:uncharacterized membrane protein YdjX (TVP38/TMEM64 family)|nr:hypothetical protein [Gammaproteobacteria bacterium]MDP6617074.1 hypothetical protein [Gammaproteobacteria bacterium]